MSCTLLPSDLFLFLFFFNDTATTEIYTLSLHDALPISSTDATGDTNPIASRTRSAGSVVSEPRTSLVFPSFHSSLTRSEEHTSELQSQFHRVCRLLLETKN